MEKFGKELLILFAVYNLLIILLLQVIFYSVYYSTDGKNKQGPSGSTGYFIGTLLGLMLSYGLWGLYGYKYVNATE
jgi:hypothetical protein